MNLEKVTLQDCIDMHEKKGCVTIINDGKIIQFQKEFPACGNRTGNMNKKSLLL